MNRHNIFLSLGSNEGNREWLLQQAIDMIRSYIGEVVRVSNIYEGEPIGFKSEKQFLNLCLEMKAEGNPHQLLLKLEAIEVKLGRLKPSIFSEYTDRTIDLDIVFFDDLVVNTEELTIPHPKMHLRRFVLEPLAELCPDFIHPVLKKTVKVLLGECPDESKLTVTLKR
ncbi:MAG: 2-amino-4-hydroxy-6-hydroxymethyldihydropteridine diphosphokinase [Bacteroidales bacterium]|jgi:2-amino-4-hydroxy-6-hydroxymethyldihydropteridine diphosphokinase|nr:2-amino-4-hydroxy-6-hydroxymethyldihydropteridine diphosphokinase [Bacteroidales bacterium]HPB01796.1 2-amino-4-hydroxy-6-hydroxymethyldihydropteridine diphosphokinase [Bacteroidales bacterium]